MQRLHGQCPGVGSVSRKEDRPEGARDGDSAPLRTVSPSNGLAPPLDRSEPRRVGWGQDTAKQGSRASCLQEGTPRPGRTPPHLVPGAPLRPRGGGSGLRSQLGERAGGATLAPGRVPRGVAKGPGSGRYCSVKESRRMRSSSSSSWRARRRRSSCSCADSSIASRSCSS